MDTYSEYRWYGWVPVLGVVGAYDGTGGYCWGTVKYWDRNKSNHRVGSRFFSGGVEHLIGRSEISSLGLWESYTKERLKA